MTAWLTWVIKSIIGFNMATTNLQIVSPILTASKTSGASLKCVWPSSEGFLNLLYYLHLKECEFRFNHRGENMYQLLLKISKKRTLNSHDHKIKTKIRSYPPCQLVRVEHIGAHKIPLLQFTRKAPFQP